MSKLMALLAPPPEASQGVQELLTVYRVQARPRRAKYAFPAQRLPVSVGVPFAAMQDVKLYEMLALFDALRIGHARERGMALERLLALIDPDTPKPVKGPMYG